MLRTGRMLALAALALSTASCGAKPGKDAVRDVQAFLTAAGTNDRAAFETYVDRAALRRDLGVQVMELGRAAGLEVEGGPSEFALNRMISPDNIDVIEPGGAPVFDAPEPEQVRAVLKRVDKRHVCVHDGGPDQTCVLTFEKQTGGEGGKAGWRLVRMPASELVVQLGAPDAKG